ncbi:hypothetical protein FX985_02869 [Pseudomonas extremaustralis]|uniref:Uncharacterized protein n=1 Tax=Pseudomonas extremaustralis TaxID=359110 RepID=A0A5M9J317_9PSED|nr:hypothetical protein FX985_02869 [Pseudomonas extremaustralis]
MFEQLSNSAGIHFRPIRRNIIHKGNFAPRGTTELLRNSIEVQCFGTGKAQHACERTIRQQLSHRDIGEIPGVYRSDAGIVGREEEFAFAQCLS